LTVRIIPRLDIKGPHLVKGVHLEGLRVLGKPEWFARHYYECGADEILFIDVVASLYGRNRLLPIIERTAREIFAPLTVGGGLRSVEDIRQTLRAGADKVALNTAAIERPALIGEAASVFGSSTIVASIAAIRDSQGRYFALTNGGRERTGVEAIGWAKQAERLGAGEILITAIDREGTGRGLDLELTRRISEAVGVPVVAAGGAGSCDHVHDAIREGRADAVAIASLLHYDYLRSDAFPANEPVAGERGDGNLVYLQNKSAWTGGHTASIGALKAHLAARSVECRAA
jgi:cyclase